MPTAIWGESEPISDETYPLTLLRQLVAQMMEQFSAQGACLALYDERIRQMVVRLHPRLPNALAQEVGADIDEIDTISAPTSCARAPGSRRCRRTTIWRMRSS